MCPELEGRGSGFPAVLILGGGDPELRCHGTPTQAWRDWVRSSLGPEILFHPLSVPFSSQDLVLPPGIKKAMISWLLSLRS